MKNYGQLIAKLRKQKGLTQEQLGRKLNVSYQAVSKWENNQSEPSLETIEKLADVFGITIAQFFEMANKDEGEIVISNIDKAFVATATNNNEGSQNSAKGNAFVQNLKKYKEWYLMIGLAIVILALALGVFVRPNKYSSDKIYQMVDPSVICVTAQGPGVQRAGSGFFIDDNGLAVTNYHVIEGCTRGSIQLNNGERYDIELVVGCDRNRDIAILQIDIDDSKSVKLGNSDKIKVGDIVYAIGYPESFQIGSASSTFTQGIISKTSFTYEGNSYIQTTVDMTHGNSGGVLINEKGQIIGITTGMLTDGNVDYMNLAIPINKLSEVKRNINVSMDEYYNLTKTRTFYFYSDDKVYTTKDYVAGDIISEVIPSKLGYQFDDWYTDTTYQTKFNFSLPVTDNNACYARWIANTYTISFDGNGGQGSMDSIKIRYDEAVALPNNAFTYGHYKFIGWRIDGRDEIFSENQPVKNLTSENNGEVVLKAVWEMESYTIHFDNGSGESGEMADFKLGFFESKPLPLNNFTRKGYEFIGWLYNGVTYNDGQIVSGLADEEVTITFVAQWQPIKYRVVFSNGNQSYWQEFTYDQSANLLPNTFESVGYHFVYWFDDDGNHYNDCQEVSNLASEPKDVLLYTRFEKNTYYIRYNSQIDGVEPVLEEQKYGEMFTLRTNPFYNEGYCFEGWQDSEGVLMENYYYSNLTTEHYGIVDVYAVWKEYEYNLKYIGLNWQTLISENYKYFDSVTIKGDLGLTREGYIFDGWRYFDDINNKYIYLKEGEIISKVPKPDYTKVVDLISVWEPIEYKISFDGNGAENGSMTDIDCIYDKEVTLPANTFTRSGYVFAYWEYNGEIITDESAVISLTSTNGEMVTLTAVWAKCLTGEGTSTNPYKISTNDEFNNFILISNYVGFEERQYFSLETNLDFDNEILMSIFSFDGIFEGNNNSISNFSLKGDGTTVALFNVNNGEIRNLSLNNVTIDDVATKAGLLVGDNNGEIDNCSANGSMSITASAEAFIGGLVAYNYNSISYCLADVDIIIDSTSRTIVGGLLGRSDGIVYNCYVTSDIEYLNIQADDTTIGGFAGMMQNGNISYCYAVSKQNLASIESSLDEVYIGGFLGYGSEIYRTYIDNCFVNVDMTINIANFSDYWYNSCPISSFNGTNGVWFNQTLQTNDYISDSSTFNITVNGQSFTVQQSAIVTEDANLKDQTWMEENLFNIVGGWKYEGGYPVFDKSSQVFEVNSLEDFLSLNNKTIFTDVKLNCNIDLSGQKFVILNNYATFDGNGFTISNLYINSCVKNIFSLFVTNKGTIKNLKLDNVSVSSETKEYALASGLVGENYGIVSNIAVYGSISAFCSSSGYSGGVCAYNYETMENCYADVSVSIITSSLSYAGGIAGFNAGSISNSISLGNVSATNLKDGATICYASGIANSYESVIKNSISFADISVTSMCDYLELSAIGVGEYTLENCSGYLQQKFTVNGYESFNTDGKTMNELTSKDYLSSLGFEEFVSQENLSNNPNAVWVIDEVNVPLLWFDKQGE